MKVFNKPEKGANKALKSQRMKTSPYKNNKSEQTPSEESKP
jgi:hypothetical protein